MSDGRRLFRVRRPAQLDFFHVEISDHHHKAIHTHRASPRMHIFYTHGSAAHSTDGQGMGACYLIFHSQNQLSCFIRSIFEVGCWFASLILVHAHRLKSCTGRDLGESITYYLLASECRDFIVFIRYSIIFWPSNMKSVCLAAWAAGALRPSCLL